MKQNNMSLSQFKRLLVLFLIVSGVFTGGSFLLPLSSAHAQKLHPYSLDPDLGNIVQIDNAIRIDWTSSGYYDQINLFWSANGLGSGQIDDISDPVALYDVAPYTRYTISIEGCTTHFLGHSSCTGWLGTKTFTTHLSQIQQKYRAIGGPAGFGNPISSENWNGSSAFYQAYQYGGWIFYNPDDKVAFAVYGSIAAKWSDYNREMGVFGLPTSDEHNWGGTGCRISDFQNGSITWCPGERDADPHVGVWL
ncbi:MAG: hypothetical protein H0W02_13565 [Ktedonobacteraceae bacterium]|nr:hypothetical protein [Ktedonobacteraceae bacterium]